MDGQQRWLYCLMVQRVSLTDSMRNELVSLAAALIRTRGEPGGDRVRFKRDDMAGELRTRYRVACLGTIVGMVFSAEIESDLSRGRVKFILDSAIADLDLETLGVLGRETSWRDVTSSFRRAGTAALN